MSPVEWYYARDNKQFGPVSAVELKRLADSGQLRPEDLVWREGMAEWATAQNVRGLFGEEGRAAEDAAAKNAVLAAESSTIQTVPEYLRRPRRHPFDAIVERFRPRFDARFVETVAAGFWNAGFWGLAAAMFLTLAIAAAMTARSGSASELLIGVAVVVVLAALHYAAWKSRDALERLNRETAGRLTSHAFPDSFAAVAKAFGAFVLLVSIAAAVASSEYFLFFSGIAAFLVGWYAAVVAMNPSTVNVSIDPELRPREEAVGVLLFLLKVSARSAAAAFGAGVVLGALGVCRAGYLLAFGGDASLPAANLYAFVSQKSLIFSASLPLAAYLAFLFGILLLGLCRAIFDVAASSKDAASAEDENQ